MICPLRITTLKIDNIVIHFEFPHFFKPKAGFQIMRAEAEGALVG